MFLLYSSLYTGLPITPDRPLNVFDSTIVSILAYMSEVWTVEFHKLLLEPNQIDKAPFEMINNKCCKYITGMPIEPQTLNKQNEPQQGKLTTDYHTQTQLVQNEKPNSLTKEASSHF